MRSSPDVDRGPKVGVACVYFSMFDAQMPADWRERQADVAAQSAAELAAEFDVVPSGLIVSAADAAEVNARFRAQGVQCVVLAPTMAAPPAFGEVVLEGLDVPVVVWNVQRSATPGADLDQVAAHEHTTLIGSVMHANALRRRGARFTSVTTRPGDLAGSERLVLAVRAALLAEAMRGGTVLRMGVPIEGYLDVEASDEQLAQLGLTSRTIEPVELAEAMLGADLARAADEARRVVGADADERSLRLADGLRQILLRERPLCAAINCHSPEIRGSEAIGVVGCLGFSLCTAAGIGLACTGDVPTAIAVSIAQRLSGRGQYCEPYAADLEAGTLLLGSAGEGDPGWAREGTLEVVENLHYPGVNGHGASLSYGLDPGPATLLSLSPVAEGWALAWIEGEIVEPWHPRMQAPNGTLRIGADASRTVDRWITSGATHHTALASGHVGEGLRDLCALLGVQAADVGAAA